MNSIFIIAEAGVNHNGSLDLAFELVDAAIEAGADAVKFQTFKAEQVVSKFAEKAEYQKKTTDEKESQYEMIKKSEVSFDDFVKIKNYCDKKGIIFLSTPFDYESVDFLENLVQMYKIGSGEITNLPFLQYIAQKNKPIVLSTGMANLSEVEEAVNTIFSNQHCSNKNIFSPLTILHCISHYPAEYEDVNLKAMLTLKEAFKLPVGYSDHSLGIEIPIAAVAMGATTIEKHFTLDKNLLGPDHKASLEPNELKTMIKAIRNVEKAFGNGIKRPTANELKIMKLARRSLIATRGIRVGETIKQTDIAIKRPGTGISPKFKEMIIGMRVMRDIRKDEPLDWEDFK